MTDFCDGLTGRCLNDARILKACLTSEATDADREYAAYFLARSMLDDAADVPPSAYAAVGRVIDRHVGVLRLVKPWMIVTTDDDCSPDASLSQHRRRWDERRRNTLLDRAYVILNDFAEEITPVMRTELLRMVTDPSADVRVPTEGSRKFLEAVETLRRQACVVVDVMADFDARRRRDVNDLPLSRRTPRRQAPFCRLHIDDHVYDQVDAQEDFNGAATWALFVVVAPGAVLVELLHGVPGLAYEYYVEVDGNVIMADAVDVKRRIMLPAEIAGRHVAVWIRRFNGLREPVTGSNELRP